MAMHLKLFLHGYYDNNGLMQKVLYNQSVVSDPASVLADSVTVSDSPAITSLKPTSDASSVTDSAALGFDKAAADTATGSDTAFRDFIKGLTEAPTATDSAAKTTGKTLIDSTSASDAGTVISQGYCDITYFAEDYVGTSVTF